MLKRDLDRAAIQGFAPREIVAVAIGVAWVATREDDAFCVPSDCTYTLNGGALSATLYQGDIRVVRDGFSYTFDVGMNIEVM